MTMMIIAVATLIGYPAYRVVRAQVTHGIERNGDRLDVDLKALGNFRFNDQTGTLADVPPEYRLLDGKNVALEGFVYAGRYAGPDNVHRFQFVYDINKCCFKGPPQVQERVFASMGGQGVSPDPTVEIRLIGTLHLTINTDEETGKILTVCTMDVKGVEPL